MEIVITRSIEAFLLPPGGILLLFLLGFYLLRRHKRAGIALLGVALLSLYALSTPFVSQRLLAWVEHYPALASNVSNAENAQAIVLLGGGRYSGAPEYGMDTVGMEALERVRYAARLHHQTGLPIIASGGAPMGEATTDAVLLRDALKEFGVTEVWLEDQSRNTAENVRFSKDLLAQHQMNKAYLVTHATHMARSVWAFERAGVAVIPAPTHFLSLRDPALPAHLQWLPDAGALQSSRVALREQLGMLWYRLRY